MPLLWQVLGNKYMGTDLVLGSHRDRKGKSSIAMGYEAGGPKEPKVLIYPAGSETPMIYQGMSHLLLEFYLSLIIKPSYRPAQTRISY
jgi:protein disulfide-isomerase A6